MPWEDIGSTNTGEMPHDEAWIRFSLNLARKYIELVSGAPPEGCELDIMWQDHELGSYPSLGIWFESYTPADYINSCERALEVFNNAVSWNELKKYFYEQEFLEDFGVEEEDYSDES